MKGAVNWKRTLILSEKKKPKEDEVKLLPPIENVLYKICCINEIWVVLLPYGHLLKCAKCALSLNKYADCYNIVKPLHKCSFRKYFITKMCLVFLFFLLLKLYVCNGMILTIIFQKLTDADCYPIGRMTLLGIKKIPLYKVFSLTYLLDLKLLIFNW